MSGSPESRAGPDPPPPADAPGLARALVEDVGRAFRRREAARAALVALAWAAGSVAILLAADAAVGVPAGLRPLAAALPVLLLAFLAGAGLAHALRPREPAVYARLAEEHAGLGHRLSTALTLRSDSPLARAFAADAAPRLAAVGADDVVPWRVARPAVAAAAALAAALAVLAARGGPSALAATWRTASVEASRTDGGPPAAAGEAAAAPTIAGLSWEATPPAYSGLPAARGDASEPVRALVGSDVRVSVDRRGGGSLAARVIGGPVPRAGGADSSLLAWRLGPADRALELELSLGGTVVERRLLPVLPIADEEPRVALEAPARDLTLAEARGALEVRAVASDDFGVRDLELRWIRSRGGGESYSFEDGALPWDRTGDAGRRVEAVARLELADLGLGPGDVLHLRAVARDGNAVAGPSEGTSETRTIRIAREGEEALVDAVLTLPARPEESPVLSQRMLILLTERLIARDPPAAELAAGAREIAGEQARLRGRVGEVIFSRAGDGSEDEAPDPFAPPEDPFGAPPDAERHGQDEHGPDEGFDPLDPEDVLEAASRATGMGTEEEIEHRHDESPVVSVNRDLLAAYNAMWEAERELRQAAASASLPPQNRALDLLQRIRAGERVFARGRVTVPPVDVPGARGTGELDEVRPARRGAAAGRADRESVAAGLERLIRDWPRLAPDRAALAATALAATLFEDPGLDPRAGALVSRAADAARAGDDAGRRLVGEALRLLAPPPPAGGAAAPPPGAGAGYFGALVGTGAAEGEGAAQGEGAAAPGAAGSAPDAFVFATARYASGDWDSAPLVPANLTHSVAQYTDIEVAAEPVIVDLSSPEVFRYPFLFLTGHLPVRFTAAEAENLRAWVERGGLIFIDDHNHDIDAAFHRTVVAEIERIFGQGSLVELPSDHEVYRAFFDFPDGPPTTTHELNGWGDGLVHETLRAVLVDGRIGVLYSNKDYASQWNYLARNKRFNAIDDTRFGVNVIVYALTR